MDKSVTIVNVVATGELDTHVNLERLYNAAETPVVDYDPVNHQGLYLRFEEEGPLITVYNSGKYIIRAGSLVEVQSQREKMLQHLDDIGVPDEINEVNFDINNIVGSASISREIDVAALAEDLQEGEAEYAPDRQCLIYRFPRTDCTIVLFRTGQAMLMGPSTTEAIDKTWKIFKRELEALYRAEN